MVIALQTGVELLLELLAVDDLTAVVAFRPQAVRDVLPLGLRGDARLRTLEPCHVSPPMDVGF